jgi:flavin reductase (DIM6/NTAB) family NADH-FMN oxidoreductase RutF
MKHISSLEFLPLINDLWLNQWFLLTSGDFDAGHYNTMAVAWGSFGIMWQKPIATVVVRPTRYTFEFIEKYETFTLTAFDLKYKDQLKLLGTKSGRDGDKIAEAGFDIVPSEKVDAPAFKQAELIIECKKIYWDDFKPENFLDPAIEEKYPKKDYHRMYFGEILAIKGVEKYRI